MPRGAWAPSTSHRSAAFRAPLLLRSLAIFGNVTRVGRRIDVRTADDEADTFATRLFAQRAEQCRRRGSTGGFHRKPRFPLKPAHGGTQFRVAHQPEFVDISPAQFEPE